MFQPLSKEQARLEIARLVENFTHQLPDYKRGRYSETEVRIHYINPFFKALGWDVNNDNGASSAYCEVVHEAKVRVGKATKAPDYLFRLPGGQNLFFLEAKKPSVDIKDDVQPAYQVRRYGWNAKMVLSLLTDFEELAVYDCTVQPDPKDKARKARLHYLTFDEYADKFDFLWDNFSKESVLRGNLDRFVASGSNRRGKETVDRAFLDTLEQMRAALARGLAARNPRLDAEQLRFLVQMLLDRLIFLRITEDRGVEAYGDLQAVLKTKGKDGSIYKALLGRFREAQNRYNSGLFDLGKDELSAKVQLGDDVLTPLINGLYYPESPYEFSVIGADILGSAYERFLGKVIELQADGTVVIEEKPEVRKAGGVFYTPAYIVEYIVKQTVGKLCEGSSPQQVARLRIVDPACGSGSFLLGAYQFLLDWHLNYYQTHPKAALPPTLAPAGPAKKGGPAARPPGSGKALTPDGHLTTAVKKTILLNNLYGVDLDEQAVEVTKLSLLLKCLEGETSASMQQSLGLERVLPTIDQNIRVGNSLVDIDFYDGELDFAPGTERAVKPFSWRDEFADVFRQGGFDAVIGNPPYALVQDDILKKYFEGHFTVVQGRTDLYELFLEKGVNMLSTTGEMGYIIPAPILTNLYSSKARQLLINKTAIKQIISFKFPVFEDPTVHTCILILAKEKLKNEYAKNLVGIKKGVISKDALTAAFDYSSIQANLGKGAASTIDIFTGDEETAGIFTTMQKGSKLLGELCFLRQCIKTGDDKRYVKEFTENPGDPWKPTLKGRSIERYGAAESNLYMNYGPWLARNWANKTFYETEKIIVRETGSRITATLDTKHHYVLSSLYAIYLKDNNSSLSHTFLLGILNSGISTYFIKKTAFELTEGAFTKFRTNQLAKLPIPALDLKKPADQQHHDTVVAFVGQLLALHPQLRAATGATAQSQLQARIRRLDQRLDHLVYLLYGLSYAEAQVVEPGLAQRLTEAEYAVWPQA
ncbi:N-6 DNA methylase [Hymenobacter sp. ISL-91]|uniref:Eco57I restriction-modification methylase domain-containing protein n=1 Tax=Hymenobacter sp. ISL-91 TaxID=2819151 RepID=UPI001BE98766|nr:TaqI-like C-terminal specificity domain-containing protein [Hymenobacter sp. ISL-91]MBT2559572.1 N-6 DNA methylase [Hymenobacter sp. ISL-91]